MAAQRGSLVAAASVLLAVAALTHPAACSPFTDILAAVETVTTSFEVANSSLAAAGGGATELAAAAGLGVRGEALKAARSTKRCSHTQPTAEEYAVAAPALAAAELFEAEEDAAYQSSRRSYFFLSFLQRTRVHREDEDTSVPAGRAKLVEVPHGFTLSPMRAGNGTTARLLANQYGPLIKIVPTHWHVLRDGTTYNQGNIPLSLISKQMVVLNRVFKEANIQFKVGVFC